MRSLGMLWLAGLLSVACTKQAPDRIGPHAEGAAEVASPRADGGGAPRANSEAEKRASTQADASADSSAAPQGGPAVVAGADAATADAGPSGAAPSVKIATIGMHVGGGPYDEPTKEPIKRSVEPRFADLARCWSHVAKAQPTDFGVDLVIEAAGGRAKVSNPRTSATGEGFVPCVVAFFESIDFQKPKHGKTVVSYSVRFRP